MNLLKETKEAIKNSGHEIEDIVFIGSTSGAYGCTWEEFEKLADTEYDETYGSPEVAIDLVIVFSDEVYLERAEYDGSEWWRTIPKLRIPEKRKQITRLASDYGYSTLEELNK